MRRNPRHPVQEDEVEWTAVRAQGAGGQNVNKVSNAVHMRYDLRRASLPEEVKARLMALGDQRITEDGVVVVKAQESRSQVKNREDALARLQSLVDSVSEPPKARKATKPTRASRERRLTGKAMKSDVKRQRGPVRGD